MTMIDRLDSAPNVVDLHTAEIAAWANRPTVESAFVATHEGMPALDTRVPRYPSFKRRLSDPMFYLAPGLMWLALAIRHRSMTLPSAANPGMDAGGLWGESKSQCLSIFGPKARRWLAPWTAIMRGNDGESVADDVDRAVQAMTAADLSFPVVAKPDMGYQGWGVRKVNTRAELAAYLETFPLGQQLILQRYVPYQGEAGVFYVRYPGERHGRIVSMALAYGPHVLGDGASTLEELILGDEVLKKNKDIYFAQHADTLDRIPLRGESVRLTFCGSARMGAVYRDARHLVTQALNRRFDEISGDIDSFYFGRFDIRFASIERFQAGKDFMIVELNGAGAEVLHIWDGGFKLRDAYKTLWRQYRSAFEIGAENRRRGARPAGLREMIRRQRVQDRLRKLYPVTT